MTPERLEELKARFRSWQTKIGRGDTLDETVLASIERLGALTPSELASSLSAATMAGLGLADGAFENDLIGAVVLMMMQDQNNDLAGGAAAYSCLLEGWVGLYLVDGRPDLVLTPAGREAALREPPTVATQLLRCHLKVEEARTRRGEPARTVEPLTVDSLAKMDVSKMFQEAEAKVGDAAEVVAEIEGTEPAEGPMLDLLRPRPDAPQSPLDQETYELLERVRDVLDDSLEDDPPRWSIGNLRARTKAILESRPRMEAQQCG
jgi:hypothetical protein